MSAAMASRSRIAPTSRPSGVAGAMRPVPLQDASVGADRSSNATHPQAGSSKGLTSPQPDSLEPGDPVRVAQREATRVWKADMRKLLDRAEERFADVCWTTATTETHDQRDRDSDLGHTDPTKPDNTKHTNTRSSQHAFIPGTWPPQVSSIPDTFTTPDTLIWAHKAILYARAPSTFHARFLNMRSPAHQLQRIDSTASLFALHQSDSQLSLASSFSRSTNTGASTRAYNAKPLVAPAVTVAKARKPIRGAAPPSSFSMKKPSLRKPVSRSSISKPLRKGSIDEANSMASGFATSDSEGEAGAAYSLPASSLINARSTPSQANPASLTSPSKASRGASSVTTFDHPTRKPSFASVSSAADSQFTDAPTVVSDASTLRAPISLAGVSPAFFEATLQYLYTSEEAMVDAFEFLFEDRLASDSENTPEQRLDKLRTDLTFMWRSKLYSDVKIVLGEGDEGNSSNESAKGGAGNDRERHVTSTKMMDIPDANMSALSLAPTLDTEKPENSDSEDDELTSFSTHRMILASRSQYFASMLLSPYADSRAPILHLPSPPFTPASLHFTLGFLYTGTLFFSNRTFDLSTAFSLWRAGAYLQIETLQALVVALIDRDFCHGFACTPPCRKCIKRVPRTLSFASSPDVSERSLRDPAIAAVSGAHFGMYWGKDVGMLDTMHQDHIVDAITDRFRQDPSLAVSVLRQLSIVGQRIDTERLSRWVDSLRLMAETVENKLMPVLQTNLERIIESQAFSDLLDGVGSLGDVLEKFLAMLIDGLTEARAAQIYQLLVGQVLLRDTGFEVAQSREAVETARASILRYLKKRWINVRALAGFNKLEKWCLKELADELDITTADLILTEGPSPAKLGLPSSRFMASRRTSSLAGGYGSGPAVAASAAVRSSTAPRSPTGGVTPNTSRLRSASTVSSASSVVGVASAARSSQRDEGEREAGPIHMRAAVLNRNAARTSVANGHRTLSTSSAVSITSSASPTARPVTNSSAVSAPSTTTMSRTSPSTAPAKVRKTTATTSVKTNSVNGSGARAIATTAAAARSEQQRTRAASSASTASVTSVRGARPNPITPANGVATAGKSGGITKPVATPSQGEKSPTPTTRRPDADKTPTKTIRNVRSATSLPPRNTTAAAKPASTSLDTKPAKTPVLGHKSSFLRATPGPGGTFSLSTTDSGYGLRARTVSGASTAKSDAGASSDRARSVTPTKATPRRMSGSSSPKSGKSTSVLEAMPADALTNVQKARDSPATVRKSESTRTIIYHPSPSHDVERPRQPAVGGGISLIIGIPCVVALHFKTPAAAGGSGRKSFPIIQAKTAPAARSVSSNAAVRGGAVRKFHAQVRFLGPVPGHGVCVGVTLALPDKLVAAITPPPLRLQQGRFGGVQYYTKGDPEREAVEDEARMERRRELWECVSPHMPFPSSTSKDEGRKGRVDGEQGLLELLVRPSDVVWVVQ